MKRTALALALLIGTAAAAHADTYTFRDILKPNGKERTMAQKRADGRKCGSRNNQFPVAQTDRFTACMRSHGWVVGNIEYAPPKDEGTPDTPDNTVVHFDDQHRHADGTWRGNRVLQADTRQCSDYGRLDYESRPFIRCMASAGWRYERTHHGQRQYYGGDDDGPDNNPPSPPDPPLPATPSAPFVYDQNGVAVPQ